MQKFTVHAPTRIDLAGGTLDIWPLYCLVGEAKTINCAIDLHASVEFETKAGSDLRFELTVGGGESCVLNSPRERNSLLEFSSALRFPLYLISEYWKRFGHEFPSHVIRVHINSKVPVGSGLGGSSALCIALTRGLARLSNRFTDAGWQWSMLNWVKDVEAAFLKVPTGTQDYLASLFGGLRVFHSRMGGIEQTDFPRDVFEEFSRRALVLYSGEIHSSGLSNWEIVKGAMEGNEHVMRGLFEIRDLADQLDNELRGHVSWKHIGQYLSEEWAIRRRAFRVHTPRLDEILSFLTSQRVLGAKVCGAAAGGSILALVDPQQKESLIARCAEFGVLTLQAHPIAKAVYSQ